MRWQRLLDRALAPVGLTHTQYLVLLSAAAAQADYDDAVPQRAIAERAALDEATTSRLVASLCERGLLDRGPTVGDRRAWRVIITRLGTRLLGRARPLADASARRFLSGP
ncbi:MAG: MarR family transcriptional regulator [Myxococcales bacterium]|nr:MarR family transcriptional regulator [Myxococcales bacterium]MBK7579662.1 MarR family transcriptional regulator [Myxococcales bacterium]